MELPDFEVFRQSLTPEDFDVIARSGAPEYIVAKIRSREDLEAMITTVYKEAVIKAFSASMELLAYYHRWLSEQL